MFGCFSTSRRPALSTRRRLALEALEARDCPSTFVALQTPPVNLAAAAQAQQTNGPAGPNTVTVAHTYLAGHNIEVTGTVNGPNAGGQVVEFQGPINGYVVTDPNGGFDFTTEASSLGTIASAVVPMGPGPNGPQPVNGPVLSNVALDTLVDVAPVITNFGVEQFNGATWEFTGMVNAPYAQGLVVTFNGQVQPMQGKTVVVNADGSFTLFATLTSNDSGLASAQIMTDWWGGQSNVAIVNVPVV